MNIHLRPLIKLGAACAPLLVPLALSAALPLSETIVDLSGNGRDGSVSNPGNGQFSENIPAALGDSGYSMDFSGSGGVGLFIDGYSGVLGGDARTVSLWIHPNSVSPNQQFLLDWGAANVGNGRRWIVRLEGNQVRLQVDGGWMRSDGTVAAGEWTHIALTFDGTLTNDTNIYINGALQTFSSSPNNREIDTADAADVRIGGHGTQPFLGQMDEVGIWSRALSLAEVQALAAGGLVSGAPDGLEVYYDFNNNVIPEPSTYALMFGVAGLAFAIYRRRGRA